MPADAPALVSLFAQLGYPNGATTIERRLRSREGESAVVLAERDEGAVGFIAMQIAEHLLTGAMAEIEALVVDQAERGNGTGAALVRAAEAWARERGVR
ncbi:MAG TPA: GNAT family N-acetyltransferase, partial [Candidatus Tumulicola sp.]